MNPAARPSLSIVAPCYNEIECLEQLQTRCREAAQSHVGADFELVLVDDGSTDGTRAAIRDLADRVPEIVAVLLSRNHGHQKALSAGLSLCRGERILVIDADLQDPPELLSDMMALMDQGAEVVYGKRIASDGESYFKRRSASAFYRLLSRLSDVDIPRDTGDFRLLSRRALDVLNSMPEEHRFIRGMVAWIGFKQVALNFERDERFAGVTKYPLRRMARLAVDAITGFSTSPLRISTYLALVIAFFGFLLTVYVVIQYFRGATLQGWSSVMVAVLMVGSAQIFVIGILGEYLGRLYMQAKKRPLFIVEEVHTGQDDPLFGPLHDPSTDPERPSD